MHLFFAPDLSSSEFYLPDEETHHFIHVLRFSQGKQIEVTDGKGARALCEAIQVSKKQVLLTVLEKENFPTPTRKLHVAIAPTKNIDRFEWFVEKATELGIAEITPLICRHSERKTLKLERIQKLMVSAARQSQHYFFPLVNAEVSFEKFLESMNENNDSAFIAHCEESEKVEARELASTMNAIVLIGPEGDFSHEEIENALKKGFKALSLGNSRLRTETAGLKAVAAFNL
ncbi:MAG: 16S rRNA (uracil(1498)-N(3))-methyltransferase [Bacteroidetes bacterium]|nr:16S rRNA (uracil(1498)-N(3))-methyltransferase [Bacteroidota bacterium]